MTDLRLYDRTGAGIVIDVDTGEVYATQSALAIITKKNKGSIEKCHSWRLKKAPVLIHVGTDEERPVNKELLNEGQITELIEKFRPSLLESIAKTTKTVKQYLYETSGYIHDL